MEVIDKISGIFCSLGFEGLSLQSVFLVFFLPVALVYALGRGLNILKTQYSKNVFAIFTIIAYSLSYVVCNFTKMGDLWCAISNFLCLCAIGFFSWVVLWQKFYSRIDNKLDSFIGNDDGPGVGEVNENGYKEPVVTKPTSNKTKPVAKKKSGTVKSSKTGKKKDTK